jgi:hypothetical protein
VLPAGAIYDMFEPSLSGGARLRIATAPQSYLGFGFRYQDYRLIDPIGQFMQGDALIYDATFGWMSASTPTTATTYFELGAAYIDETFTLDAGDDDHPTYTYEDQGGAFVMRSGVMLPFSSGMALDLGLSWIYKGLIFVDEGEPTGSLIGIHIGLTWKG